MVAKTYIKKKKTYLILSYDDFPDQDLINHYPVKSLHQSKK